MREGPRPIGRSAARIRRGAVTTGNWARAGEPGLRVLFPGFTAFAFVDGDAGQPRSAPITRHRRTTQLTKPARHKPADHRRASPPTNRTTPNRRAAPPTRKLKQTRRPSPPRSAARRPPTPSKPRDVRCSGPRRQRARSWPRLENATAARARALVGTCAAATPPGRPGSSRRRACRRSGPSSSPKHSYHYQ